MENIFVTEVDKPSVTCTVNVDVPEVVAVPVITPDDESDNPEGSELVMIVHSYGNVPPVTLSVSTYATPALTFCNGDKLVIAKGDNVVFVRTFKCPVESVISVVNSVT